MFLIVFVTFIISIIGLYAQVLALQTAKINAAQSALTQTMVTWHKAATGYIHSLSAPPDGISVAECQITSATIYSPIVCTLSGAPLLVSTSGWLPINIYQFNPYTFLSTVFQPAGFTTVYVVTYINPNSEDTIGNLILPSGGTVGYTINDVAREFSNISTGSLSYGIVTAGVTQNTLTILGVSQGSVGAGLTFPVPLSVPVGAIAIISATN